MTDQGLLKKEIRKRLIYERGHMNEKDRRKNDLIIIDKLVALKEYREADLILVYASYNGEVDTFRLIERALADGKSIACPRCRIEDNVPMLDFYRITSSDELIPGYKGIPEPRPDKGDKLSPDEIRGCLVIVPLVGYDKEKNRLGYGKGFYDRFFKANMDLKKIGLAYRCQEEEKLPIDEYDVKLDMIINESDQALRSIYEGIDL